MIEKAPELIVVNVSSFAKFFKIHDYESTLLSPSPSSSLGGAQANEGPEAEATLASQ